MGAAELVRLFGIQRGVDAAENDGRPALPGEPADLVAAQGVARVYADTHDVAGFDGLEVEDLEGLVSDARLPMRRRRRTRQDEKPARCDHSDAKRQVTRVHQMDCHICLFSQWR